MAAGADIGRASTRSPLSVVIATRDRPQMLERCLSWVLDDLTTLDEVIVVDSASRTAVPQPADSVGGTSVRVLRAPRPGTSLARNIGWRAARNDVIAFIDDDVEVKSGWADALSAGFNGEARPAWLTGWIGIPDRQAGVAEPSPLMVEPRPFVIDRDRRGLIGAGANLAVSRPALERVGGFDERLGPGSWLPAGEDHDLMDRLLAAGLVGAYLPDARVDHNQWRGRRQSLGQHWRIGLGGGVRLARLARHDRQRLPQVARQLVVDDIAHAVSGSIRDGYQAGTIYALLRLAGLLTGLVAALAIGLT